LEEGSAGYKAATYTQTSMLRVGFEPTIPVLEWAKRGHALDRAAAVIGVDITALNYLRIKFNKFDKKIQNFH
jgi:hypothetical protein